MRPSSDIFRYDEDLLEGHVVRIEKIKYFYTLTLAGKYQRVMPLEIVNVELRTIFEGVCLCVCVRARARARMEWVLEGI